MLRLELAMLVALAVSGCTAQVNGKTVDLGEVFGTKPKPPATAPSANPAGAVTPQAAPQPARFAQRDVAIAALREKAKAACVATIEIDGGVACDLAEPALSPAFAEVWGRAAGFSRKAIIGAPTQRAADTAALKLSVSLDGVTPKPQVSAKVKKGVRLVLTIEEPRK